MSDVKSNVPAVAQAAGVPAVVSPNAWDELEQEDVERLKPLEPKAFAGTLASKSAVRRFRNALLPIMRSLESDDRENAWYPSILEISSATKPKSLVDGRPVAGENGIYEAKTKQPLPPGTRVFPVFAHDSNAYFGDQPKPMCKSQDAQEGVQYLFANGQSSRVVHTCGGPTCPNPGYMYKASRDATPVHSKKPAHHQTIPRTSCNIDKIVYLVDESFTNVYTFAVRQYGIDDSYKLLVRELKNTTFKLDFDPTLPGATWWNVYADIPKDKQGKRQGNHPYFQMRKTNDLVAQTKDTDGTVIGADLAKCLLQVQFWVGAYHKRMCERAVEAANKPPVNVTPTASGPGVHDILKEMTSTIDSDFGDIEVHGI